MRCLLLAVSAPCAAAFRVMASPEPNRACEPGAKASVFFHAFGRTVMNTLCRQTLAHADRRRGNGVSNVAVVVVHRLGFAGFEGQLPQ